MKCLILYAPISLASRSFENGLLMLAHTHNMAYTGIQCFAHFQPPSCLYGQVFWRTASVLGRKHVLHPGSDAATAQLRAV